MLAEVLKDKLANQKVNSEKAACTLAGIVDPFRESVIYQIAHHSRTCLFEHQGEIVISIRCFFESVNYLGQCSLSEIPPSGQLFGMAMSGNTCCLGNRNLIILGNGTIIILGNGTIIILGNGILVT